MHHCFKLHKETDIINSRGIVLVYAERHDTTIMLIYVWALGKATNMKTRFLHTFRVFNYKY